MKWIGWAFALVLALVAVAVHQAGSKQTAARSRQAAAQIEEKQQKVDAIFAKAEKGVGNGETRLREETRKAEALVKQRDELAERRASLNAKRNTLMADADSLRDAKEAALSQRTESVADIRQVQRNLASLEQQIRLLKKALRSVTAPAEL